VIKLLLSKFAPLSVDMQRAVITDQAVINDADTQDVEYVDHEVIEIDKEAERMRLMIEDAQTIEELEQLEQHASDDQLPVIQAKKTTLSKPKKTA